MKTLHLNDHLAWSGGIETYLLSVIPRMEQSGHAQAVAFAHGDGALVSESYHMPLLARGDRASLRESARQMQKLLREVQPDVVHVHNIYNVGAIRACLDAVPTVLHGHDYRYLCPASSFYFRRNETVCERTCGPQCFVATLGGHCLSLRPKYAWNYYHRVRTIASCAKRFALTIVPSQYVRQRFMQAGFPQGAITVLPYFCPLAPLDEPRPLPDRPTLLFIGRVRPNKGIRYFVEAIGRLPEQVQGIMVGDFSEQISRDVQKMAAANNCHDRLQLRPWARRDQVRNVFSEATLIVFPSIWPETLGIVGLEAFACGVPAVASDIGGVSEWLMDGHTGKLVPPKDAAAIANAARSIIESPAENRRLGMNGLSLVKSKFCPISHIDQLQTLYASACQAEPASITTG